MRTRTLDETDRQILGILQEDSSITKAELAKRVGLTLTSCSRRVQNLEKAGVIRGYHAVIDPEALGYSLTVSANVRFNSADRKFAEEFIRCVEALDLVREVHKIVGGREYRLTIVARGLEAYNDFVGNELGPLLSSKGRIIDIPVIPVVQKHGVPELGK